MVFEPVILLDAIFLVHLCQAMKAIEIWVIQVWTGSFEGLKKTQELQLQGDNKVFLIWPSSWSVFLFLKSSMELMVWFRCMFELCSPK